MKFKPLKFLVFVFSINCVNASLCFARQEASQVDSNSPRNFARVVSENFSQWDGNGDGELSKDEVFAAVADPKYHGEAAAAIAAIAMVVRSGNFELPALTKGYLTSPAPPTPPRSAKSNDSEEDDASPQKGNRKSPFESDFDIASRKLRSTARDLFPQSMPSLSAAHQGKLGDCPFVSTVGAILYRDPMAIKNMLVQDGKGGFTVKFGDGEKIKIAHLNDADIAIWSSAGTNGLWFTVLEKAYRQALLDSTPLSKRKQEANSIYEKFGPSLLTIEILDGHKVAKFPLHQVRQSGAQLNALQHELTAAMRNRLLVKASTPGKKSTPGITPAHAYAVLGYDEKADLVSVWNPHGNNFTPKGPDGLKNGYTTKTGMFKIPLKEMVTIFDDINIETRESVE